MLIVASDWISGGDARKTMTQHGLAKGGFDSYIHFIRAKMKEYIPHFISIQVLLCSSWTRQLPSRHPRQNPRYFARFWRGRQTEFSSIWSNIILDVRGSSKAWPENQCCSERNKMYHIHVNPMGLKETSTAKHHQWKLYTHKGFYIMDCIQVESIKYEKMDSLLGTSFWNEISMDSE